MARTRALLFFPLSLPLYLSACDHAGGATGAPRPVLAEPAPPPTPIDRSVLPQSAYRPAEGRFLVHEWGTLTSVVGSDGVALPGLHHEEEDLPEFVADRLAQAKADPSRVHELTYSKMETPVTYFYAPSGRTVTAWVGFPAGMLTQWYPYVSSMFPPMTSYQGQLVDRYLQPVESIPTGCQSYFTQVGNGIPRLGHGRGAAARGPAGAAGSSGQDDLGALPATPPATPCAW